ncbi:probable protein phosphatase 2C 24 [Coffea eugenioides]|uniref:probable protein phosphatase 2C 24 n=1 Tax=Coffea eugenioides TaxID=49369 RepID=UPI000F60F24A|nr:probable protein phosphatase 2C 24 [Coffea eugenioides]
MAEICCGVASEREAASSVCKPSSRAARRRRMEIRRIKFVAHPEDGAENGKKRPRLEIYPAASVSRECDYAVGDQNLVSKVKNGMNKEMTDEFPPILNGAPIFLTAQLASTLLVNSKPFPKFGMASVCGRRRDMEDAVAIRPSFCRGDFEDAALLHYFAVYDGHGCSHVAAKCRERLHELVKEELESREESTEWKNAMERSFIRMDKEVVTSSASLMASNCRCELQTPECDAVGSAAVVAIVTPDKIIVANCGDSRAVLCRNGKAIPLSDDHKPDRPDELNRIQGAGGRVIYWDCPRVQGVLAMSRAIGDNYLKPYVSCVPEVTITDRTADDDCLILASDGLWDVVSNDTACGVARMCLKKGKGPPCSPGEEVGNENSDKACSDASMLLTKLALARRSADNVSVVVIDLRKDVSRLQR